MADNLPFYVVMAVGVPETIMFIILGFQLFNDSIKFRQALIISIIGSTANYFIRAFNVTFGIHTVVTVITYILVCYLITKKNVWKISSAVVCGTVLFLFFEWIFYCIIRYFDSSLFMILPTTPWLHILLAFPPTILVGLTYIIARKWNLHLFNDASYEIDK